MSASIFPVNVYIVFISAYKKILYIKLNIMTKSNISEVLQLQETKIHKNLMMTFYRFYILQNFVLMSKLIASI